VGAKAQLFRKKPCQKYPSGAGFRKSRAQNSFLGKSRAQKQYESYYLV